MKRRGNTILIITFLLALIAAVPTVSFAQDVDVPEVPEYEEQDSKQSDLFEHNADEETETSKELNAATHEEASVPAHHQTTVTHRKKAEPQKKQPKPNSILSYNFLYYMIQEFKLSDIVDE